MGDKVESRGELQAVKAPLGGQLAAIPPLFPLPIDYCPVFRWFPRSEGVSLLDMQRLPFPCVGVSGGEANTCTPHCRVPAQQSLKAPRESSWQPG